MLFPNPETSPSLFLSAFSASHFSKRVGAYSSNLVSRAEAKRRFNSSLIAVLA
jgi:hypothetical protein